LRETYKSALSFVLCVWLITLVACQQALSNPENVPSSRPTALVASTHQLYLTPGHVLEYPDQLTDGKLLLSIEAAGNTCLQPGKPAAIRIIFSNLTDQALTIPADFSGGINPIGAGGNLIRFITNAEGAQVFSFGDREMLDIFPTPSNIHRKIPAHQYAEFEVDFTFPEELAIVESSEDYQMATPTPGQYFLRIVYGERPRSDDIWHGAVGSNRLEICVRN